MIKLNTGASALQLGTIAKSLRQKFKFSNGEIMSLNDRLSKSDIIGKSKIREYVNSRTGKTVLDYSAVLKNGLKIDIPITLHRFWDALEIEDN